MQNEYDGLFDDSTYVKAIGVYGKSVLVVVLLNYKIGNMIHIHSDRKYWLSNF